MLFSFAVRRLVFFALPLALVGACAPLIAGPPTDASSAERSAPLDPSAIAVFATGTPPQPYMVVGFVAADAATSDEAIVELQRRAATLGGDAIISLGVSRGAARRVHVTGAAVRYS